MEDKNAEIKEGVKVKKELTCARKAHNIDEDARDVCSICPVLVGMTSETFN